MSFKKLRDLRDRFESKWINGGFLFGYENDINENHNNDYPLLLVLPPTSEIPSTESESQEEFTFECLVVKPYYQNQTGSLDVVFSLLEQESLSWLQRVLDSYTKKEVILSPDSISVEREKELYNDKLIQIRLTFTLNCFSHNFTHVDELLITNLSPRVWLRSDMGVKTSFSGGNEVVSKWIDQSGNGNHFEQTTTTKMPSYEYESTDNGYPFISFDGTDDFLQCVNSGISSGGSGIAHDHTIFIVTKIEDNAPSSGIILCKEPTISTAHRFFIESKDPSTGGYIFAAAYRDDDVDFTIIADSEKLSTIFVHALRFKEQTLTHFRDGIKKSGAMDSGYDNFSFYGGTRPIVMGAGNTPEAIGATAQVQMKMQELIIFNDDLTDSQVQKVSSILEHKYNISN